MIVPVGQLNEVFLDARPAVYEVMDDDALFMAYDTASAAWDDLFHCWCGCPL